MPRLRIIILEKQTDDFRFVLWADVPAARQAHYASENPVQSAWPGATAADNDALKTGAVAERVGTQRYVAGTPMAQVQALMQQVWTDYQAEITAANPWVRYGSTWDGTTWTVAAGA